MSPVTQVEDSILCTWGRAELAFDTAHCSWQWFQLSIPCCVSEKENKCSFPLKLQSTLNSTTQAIPFSWITTDSAPSVRCSTTVSAFRRWGQEITRLTPRGWVTKYFPGRPMLIRQCILNQNLTKSKTTRKQNKAPHVKWASKAIMVWETGQLRLPGGHCWVWIKEPHSTGSCMALTLTSRVSNTPPLTIPCHTPLFSTVNQENHSCKQEFV